MKQRRPLDLVYDGQCNLCLRAVRTLRVLDTGQRLRYHDGNDGEMLTARFPMLQDADVDMAMFLVKADGSFYRGFFAFRELVWLSPLTWPLAILFYFPGAAMVGPHVYAWIAKNRRRLGCNSQSCSIAPPGAQASGVRHD